MTNRILIATAVLALSALPAAAHYPFCTCAAKAGEIICEGGFSDGTSAEGVKLDVISYEEDVLVPAKFDASSKVSFQKPEGEFYVLFDAGPGHIVEVDYQDIEGLAP
ncbi:hypothetical protein [Paracoccus aminophilus]|uniref:Uncharacterized protein n=1 Tax=Paracoccus aminophilus JCM 7686 TaxID=1367847 RepID=S5XTW4_PARAH|nr:hypothetical protein [Paracoccus aminophilus]AGT08612.1 hypothetical protein JCM7686_1511 [Paracoccus aminophilus JCM 7686]